MILDNCVRQAVICYIMNADNEVLAVKLIKDADKGKDVYYLPGGGIEPGESILDATYRELKEEVKIEQSDILEISDSKESFLQEFSEPIEATFENDGEKVLVKVIGQRRHIIFVKLGPEFKLKATSYDEFSDIKFMNKDELKLKFKKPEQLELLCP